MELTKEQKLKFLDICINSYISEYMPIYLRRRHIGALNLPHEEAANIQDTFAEFIVNKLNGKFD